ncbi:TadE family protein [Actinomyces sp. Chiba101]|uniref:TadE-like protein n=1 Tax=Actinomyces denticolens TaxID=52767 RepID=A0ABY1I0C7_9ACTO|nr:TadE family protein [Actinomyces denticolens]BAW92639.1 TadE family protein [Actinomyces sp. Chiba101]GAV94399.1 TadE family protein [Actinomyces denticolens]SHI40664.1 TadE-like protein [Actinomyces denticolens]SUU07888.1 TadE-like protein [Actinomyces denticolens]
MRSERCGPCPPRDARTPGRGSGEEGSAIAEFVMVGALVIAVAVALLQLALGLYARNVLTDAAGEGARRAALAGGTEEEASARVRALVGAALADDYVTDVRVRRVVRDGLPVVEVEASAPLPVLGLLGPGGTLRVSGRALDEAALARAGAAP